MLDHYFFIDFSVVNRPQGVIGKLIKGIKMHLENTEFLYKSQSSFLAEVALPYRLLSSMSFIIFHYLSLNAADYSILCSLYQLLKHGYYDCTAE